MTAVASCPLCHEAGGQLVWQGRDMRIVRALDDSAAPFPAFYRLIHTAHVAEFSDLPAAQQLPCLQALAGLERLMREHLAPTKMNIASLGNVVPHLHWHVVARFDWDSHFPAPVWAAPQRPRDPQREAWVRQRLPALEAAIAPALAAWG